MVVPADNGYSYKNWTVFPVITKECIKANTGAGTLTKHPLAGYSFKGEIKLTDQEKQKEIFHRANRVG